VTSPEPEVPSTPQLLTIDDLRRLFRCGRTTAYARVREPGFPAALVLSGSAHRWWLHEVLAWLEGHRVDRSTGDAPGARDLDSSTDRMAPPPVPQPVELRRRNRIG
jgi:predicted DNA-binding transcriptional regulator AlpA